MVGDGRETAWLHSTSRTRAIISSITIVGATDPVYTALQYNYGFMYIKMPFLNGPFEVHRRIYVSRSGCLQLAFPFSDF